MKVDGNSSGSRRGYGRGSSTEWFVGDGLQDRSAQGNPHCCFQWLLGPWALKICHTILFSRGRNSVLLLERLSRTHRYLEQLRLSSSCSNMYEIIEQ